MRPSECRILLAVEPGVLEGALARLLSVAFPGDVVQSHHVHQQQSESDGFCSSYDAAVVSDELPEGVHADVVITLPDTRGSGGTATVRRGDNVDEVSISDAEGLVELLQAYLPGRKAPVA